MHRSIRNSPSCRTLTFGVALTAALLAPIAAADLISWTNATGDHQWNTPANWDLGRKPNGTDFVLISAPGSDAVVVHGGLDACGTLVSSHPVQIEAGANFHVYGSASFNGGLTILLAGGSPLLMNHGTITVGTFGHFYGGIVLQDAGTTFTFQANCATTFYAPFSFIKGFVFNHGTMHLQAPVTMTAFNSNETINFTNQLDGWIYFDNGSAGLDAASLSGPSYFINYGNCNFAAGGFVNSKLATYNVGTYYVLSGLLNIGNFQSIDGSGTLLEGSYYLYNGARIQQSTNAIHTIDSDAFVYLSGKDGLGVSSFMDGIYAADTIYGVLYVDGGAELTLAPDFFGTVKNHGKVGVGPGGKMTVNGGYTCYADGTHNIAVADATPTGIGVFQTYTSMLLSGTLQVDFYDDMLPTVQGASFVVANLVDPQSAFISGAFAQAVVLPANGYDTHVEYGTGVVKLVVGSACAADLDGSGTVDGGDLGLLLGGWGVAGPADLDGNGVVDGGDLGLLLGAWGGCP